MVSAAEPAGLVPGIPGCVPQQVEGELQVVAGEPGGGFEWFQERPFAQHPDALGLRRALGQDRAAGFPVVGAELDLRDPVRSDAEETAERDDVVAAGCGNDAAGQHLRRERPGTAQPLTVGLRHLERHVDAAVDATHGDEVPPALERGLELFHVGVLGVDEVRPSERGQQHRPERASPVAPGRDQRPVHVVAVAAGRDEGPRGPQGAAPDVEGEENAVGWLLLHRIDVTRDHGQALTQPHDLDAVLLGHVCADEVVRDHTGQ